MKNILSFFRDKRGVSSLEYAILAGIVIVGLTAGVGSGNTGLKSKITTLFSSVTSDLTVPQ